MARFSFLQSGTPFDDKVFICESIDKECELGYSHKEDGISFDTRAAKEFGIFLRGNVSYKFYRALKEELRK